MPDGDGSPAAKITKSIDRGLRESINLITELRSDKSICSQRTFAEVTSRSLLDVAVTEKPLSIAELKIAGERLDDPPIKSIFPDI